ncbi:MAG: hypothetical protein E6I85_00425 [Chloroflexi bacterium]|nr:MAG: hypothetical protein E6I85_00425 [Chloroflexota bacterium]
MRSLETQVRLRRLLRVYADFSGRLAATPGDGPLGEAARSRLLELAGQVHEAWSRDSATVAVPALRRHVTRTLAAVDQAIASLGTAQSPRRLAEELQEAALPLLLMLRGMEEVPDRQVQDWLGAADLAKTA